VLSEQKGIVKCPYNDIELVLCLQSEKEEKELEKDVEENKQKEEKETK
jgi:hypothetical protein